MNLKESFRYQRFLENMMRQASMRIIMRDNCLTITKVHNRQKANPDAENTEETIERPSTYYPNDTVIDFMVWLCGEREKLTKAIGEAKASVGFDIDAAVEANKFRQNLAKSIREMLVYKAAKRIEAGRDYKFNAEGNQTPYTYNIDVIETEAYDKVKAKGIMQSMNLASDATSAEIDAAMINTTVDYQPTLDVNYSFDDVMEVFCSIHDTVEE